MNSVRPCARCARNVFARMSTFSNTITINLHATHQKTKGCKAPLFRPKISCLGTRTWGRSHRVNCHEKNREHICQGYRATLTTSICLGVLPTFPCARGRSENLSLFAWVVLTLDLLHENKTLTLDDSSAKELTSRCSDQYRCCFADILDISHGFFLWLRRPS